MTYKALQHVIIDCDGWMMLEHLLTHCDPHIGGKADDIQKKIYDLNKIPGEDLAFLINIGYILHKKNPSIKAGGLTEYPI